MTSIFANAHFGKAYKTRDGRKALFMKRKESNSDYYILLIKSDFGIKRIDVNINGKSLYEKSNDIVSEWRDTINEEELDELAYGEAQLYSIVKSQEWQEGFKDGYRKAIKI